MRYNFFEQYDKLGKLQQEIWKRVAWYCKKYPNAHPTQEKIAHGIPCSRKHVNRTLALFQQLGWISLISRGARRAKTLLIHPELLVLDVANRQYVRKLEVTSEVTHSTSVSKYTSKSTGVYKKNLQKPEVNKLDIPSWVEKKSFCFEDKLKLAMCSREAYAIAFKEVEIKLKMKWPIQDVPSYLVETTLSIAKNKGEKLDWKSYYHTKQMYMSV